MTPTEVKKELYKQKPIAHFKQIVSGIAYYTAILGFEEAPLTKTVCFSIPISDMQETSFGVEMDAKLLIRWIV